MKAIPTEKRGWHPSARHADLADCWRAIGDERGCRPLQPVSNFSNQSMVLSRNLSAQNQRLETRAD